MASGNLRQSFGFFTQELEVGGDVSSVEDVLRTICCEGGGSLADRLIEGGRVSPQYAVFLNGVNIEALQGLKTHVRDEGKVVVMDVVARIAGGRWE